MPTLLINWVIFRSSVSVFRCNRKHLFFKYLGKWYEVERYFAWFEFGGRCVIANYSMGEDDSVKIVNTQISLL